MGTLQLAIFILIIPYFRAVNALAQSPTYLDAQNEKNNNPLTLPLSLVDTTTTAQTDLIVTDNNNPAPCSSSVYNPITGGRLKRRGGGKQRRGGANNKNSESSTCPSPATITTPTDTDTSPSNKPDEQQQQQQQQPQTEAEKKGPGAAHDDGSPKPDEQLNWPNLFKIPTKDGDNPACFQVTNGLMPVGVCENPTLQPEPSRWDVFMKVNHDIYPRAWKLPDSQLGTFFIPLRCFFSFASRDLINCSPHSHTHCIQSFSHK